MRETETRSKWKNAHFKSVHLFIKISTQYKSHQKKIQRHHQTTINTSVSPRIRPTATLPPSPPQPLHLGTATLVEPRFRARQPDAAAEADRANPIARPPALIAPRALMRFLLALLRLSGVIKRRTCKTRATNITSYDAYITGLHDVLESRWCYN